MVLSLTVYRISSTYPIMAAWPSGYIAPSCAHDTCRGYGSIFAHVFFLYYIIVTKANIGIHWNLLESVGIPRNVGIPMDSNRFQQIPMETIPRGSQIPNDSSGFRRIPLEIPWNGKPTFQSESSRFCQNSWGTVKTSVKG